MMKKYLYTLFFWAISSFTYAQTDDMKYEIESSISNFFSAISDLNDPDSPLTFERIVATYQKADDFTFNGNLTSMTNFLNYYQTNILKDDNISHSIQRKRKVDIKLAKAGTDIYSYTGVLHRILMDDDENVKVKDIDVNIEVFYDRKKQDNRVLIRSISFTPQLSKVKAAVRNEFVFDSQYKTTHIGSDETLTSKEIKSTKTTVRYFPGIEDTERRLNFTTVPFSVIKTEGGIRKVTVLSDSVISCELYRNSKTTPSSYTITLGQSESNNQFIWNIVQAGRSRSLSLIEKLIKYDNDDERHDISLFYSPKFDLGLSYMYTPESCRFGFGLTLATTFNSYGEIFSSKSSNSYSFTSIGDHTLNGYKVEHDYLHPYNENYSAIMDPNGEAKLKTVSSLLLANVGLHVNDWLRFDLGIGAACSKNIYHMDNAYGVDKFTFVKTNSSLPDVEPYYHYSIAVKDWDYKDKNKWGFAIRPSLNFMIPLDKYYELCLPIGIGYTYVTNNNSISSIDFSIGVSFSVF